MEQTTVRWQDRLDTALGFGNPIPNPRGACCIYYMVAPERMCGKEYSLRELMVKRAKFLQTSTKGEICK